MNDFETVDRLVKDNIRLAHYFARKWYTKFGENDAFSLALSGLHKAAIKHDSTRNEFGKYAALEIRWAFAEANQATKAQRRGSGIADLPIDAPLGDSDEFSLASVLADKTVRHPGEVLGELGAHETLRELMLRLPERTRKILERRFGFGKDFEETLEEISADIGLTRERVRQIEEEGLDTLARFQQQLRPGWQEPKRAAPVKKSRGCVPRAKRRMAA